MENKIIDGKKATTICILEILKKYSDDNHLLTHKDIINHLYSDYGIVAERKAVASSLKILEALEYDVNTYHKRGTALLARDLEKSEIQFLIDAVFSSKIITDKQAKELSTKIMSCLSKNDQKSFSYLYKTSQISRTDNKNLFYTIETINEAIEKKKQIKFNYLQFNKDKTQTKKYNDFTYYVTPYFLVNNFGKYYLVAKFWSKPGYSMYRLERIANVDIDYDHEATGMDEVFGKDFSIANFINEHVYMFGGETITATISFEEENVVNYIYDWFDDSARIYEKDNKKYADIKTNENAFYFWALQYGDSIEVISPDTIRNRIKESLQKQLDKYN